jgi:ATP-dependent Clp protease adaptor protein ClpS
MRFALPTHGRKEAALKMRQSSYLILILGSEPARAGEDVNRAGEDGMSKPGQTGNGGTATGIVTKTKPKTKKPSLYKVLILNDDYTPMEFVVHILERFFAKPREEAVRIMLHVHRHGVGICGVYTYEVAETKVTQVVEFARRHQHPLQCTMEKE